MTGIFGNDPMDRYRDKELNDHLEDDDQKKRYFECDSCDFAGNWDEWETTGKLDELVCPECGNIILMF